jgi:hypothetical protein
MHNRENAVWQYHNLENTSPGKGRSLRGWTPSGRVFKIGSPRSGGWTATALRPREGAENRFHRDTLAEVSARLENMT